MVERHAYLRLLVDEAPLPRYDEVLRAAAAHAASAVELEQLHAEHDLALQLRDLMERQRARHEQQRALVDCAKELADIHIDPDRVLTLIVTQAQRLLGADMAYLSLNDDERRETRMRVMVGATSSVWKDVPIPYGTGVGGKVAASAAPFSTSDYFADDRLTHDPAVDASVRAERQVSIVGVPLMRHGAVIGVLFAANRAVGRFSHDAIALLGSFAALAALAIDQAHLMSDKERALAALQQANEALEKRTADFEKAVAAHDRSMEIVLGGGGVQEVVAATSDQLGGALAIVDEWGTPVARTPGTPEEVVAAMLVATSGDAGRSGRSVRDGACWVTSLVAGTEHLGMLVWSPPPGRGDVDGQDRQLLERAAVVASLLRLFDRNLAAAEARVRGELLDDLLAPTPHTWSSLAERAQRSGYDPRKRHAVVVAHVPPDGRGRLGSATSDLAADGQPDRVRADPAARSPGHRRCRRAARRPGRPPRRLRRGVGVYAGAAPARPRRRLRHHRRPRLRRPAPERQRVRRRLRDADARPGDPVRRRAVECPTGDPRDLLRHRAEPGHERAAAARAPEHRHATPGPGQTAPRRELEQP